jgi:hypothetical protein
MSQEPIILEDGDVILVQPSASLMNMRTMFRKDEFERVANEKILGVDKKYWERDGYADKVSWIDLGSNCEALVMKAGKWMPGKVKYKITLEFYPDEPIDVPEQTVTDSPLDDIRQYLKQDGTP